MSKALSGRAALVEMVYKFGLENNKGYSKAFSERLVNAIQAEITQQVVQSGKYSFSGLGTLKKVHRSARSGRNPQTGEALAIPAKDTVVFSISKNFKNELNGISKKD